MAKARVVVVGAGFGGLELASRLSDEAPELVDITLIDKSDAFVFGFSKLDVLFGHATLDDVRVEYSRLTRPSVTFRQELVTAIDPTARRVTTDHGWYVADALVIALGADLDPAATPGLVEGGHEFYTVEGAELLASALPGFESGHVVVGVMGTPYKCPPAPCEAALMLHDYLVERGVRGKAAITVASPFGTPIPPSPDTSAALLAEFESRDITFLAASPVASLEPGRGSVRLHTGAELDCDLFLGVPLHRAPQVVVDAGLTVNGWVDVDPYTLATKFPAVWSVGDVANAPVPRAGVFAERAAGVVADQILAQLRGSGEAKPYDGYGNCYIEFGGGRVAQVEVTFITAEGPKGGPFSPPSLELAREKKLFASSRRERWFNPTPTALGRRS